MVEATYTQEQVREIARQAADDALAGAGRSAISPEVRKRWPQGTTIMYSLDPNPDAVNKVIKHTLQYHKSSPKVAKFLAKGYTFEKPVLPETEPVPVSVVEPAPLYISAKDEARAKVNS